MDRKKNVWFTTSSGLYRFEDGHWKKHLEADQKWKPNTLFVDKQERVWIGTDDRGVYLIENDNVVRFIPGIDIPEGPVKDIFEDRHGNTWIVSKKGITRMDWNLAEQ